ncbi:MAG TPA: alpha/beta fold hydrolase [Candidatus Kapabacteria bacterium]|nr:alpha/beta fold hydrolase [Candidatus Kapabacteria bacterium]
MSGASTYESFSDSTVDPPIRGFLHRPTNPNGSGLVLTHGAGVNCRSSLLIAMAEGFSDAGFIVLRCDLPFRQLRPFGPPHPGQAARDQEGLKRAVETLRKKVSGKVFLGGHSYGGRQATMLSADEPEVADGLLLLSYPLHPPRKPEQLRTQHFPKLQTKSLFIHGTRDPLGLIDEMEEALKLIPAEKLLVAINGAGHDLGFQGKKQNPQLALEVLQKFKEFFAV